MNNAVYRKTMENLRSTVDVKLVSNKKDYLKMASRPIYRSHKIIYKELVAIRKNKVTLALNKTGYIQMYILELKKCCCANSIMITVKINMVTTQDYYSQTLIV